MTVPVWELSQHQCPNCQRKLTRTTKKGRQLHCGFCGYGLAGLLSGGPAYVADTGGDGGGQTGSDSGS